MSILSILRDEKLVSESLSPLLFGKGRSAPINNPMAYPMLAHSICIFYASAIQARIVKNASLGSLTVEQYLKNDRLSKTINDIWKTGEYDLSKKSTVFSFLHDCSETDALKDMFDTRYERAREEESAAFEKFMDHGRTTNIGAAEDSFLDLIRYLKSLSAMEIDITKQVLTLNGEIIPYTPFLSFSNDVLYMTSSASRGEQNGFMELSQFRFYQNPESHNRTIQFNLNSDEKNILFTRAMNINPNWYKREEYLDNCTFVVNLADVLSQLIIFDIHECHGIQGHINKKIQKYFVGTDLIKTTSDIKTKIRADGSAEVNGVKNDHYLQNLFMGYIIKYGAYRTTYALIYDDDPFNEETHADYSKINYYRMMNKLVEIIYENELSSIENPEEALNMYRNNIKAHIDKLAEIIPQMTPAYKKRVAEIYAEQRTNCIMYLLGSTTEAFIDQERILSIQDYCDMVEFRTLGLPEIVYKLVEFLIRFYSNITGVSAEVEKDLSPPEYMEMFREFCEKCEGNERLEKWTGRRHICDIAQLNDFVDESKKIKSWDSDGFTRITEDYIFVSYNRKDSEFINGFVEQWRREGYNIVFDRGTIRNGDNWKSKVYNTIKDKHCKGVFVFLSKNSIDRETIKFELDSAFEIETMRRKENTLDNYNFVIAVNMHPENNLEWIAEELYNQDANSKEFKSIVSIKGKFDDSDVFIPHDSNFDYSIREELNKRLSLHDKTVDFDTVSDDERLILSFILFLKSGEYVDYEEDNQELIKRICEGDGDFVYRCVYPLVITVDERRIKRDKITIIGYEILNGKKQNKIRDKTMITSDNLVDNDYYCIPNLKSCGECGEWISNPLLVTPEEVMKWKSNF